MMVPFLFNGHDFRLLPEGALYWPRHGALLVADLHLEKASAFARLGQFLPPYDSIETLACLEKMVERTGARAIWCLGDSFHDAGGPARLSAPALARLRAIARHVDWTWIRGNHDADGDPPVGSCVTDRQVDGLWLRHEAVAGDASPEISGHYHPKLRVRHRGQHVSRRCFLASESKMILPAFGALAGGLDATAPALRAAVGPNAVALVPTANRLLKFAI